MLASCHPETLIFTDRLGLRQDLYSLCICMVAHDMIAARPAADVLVGPPDPASAHPHVGPSSNWLVCVLALPCMLTHLSQHHARHCLAHG